MGIGGIEYRPPSLELLHDIFDKGIEEIGMTYKNSKTSQAIALFLFGARNQFYYDENKITSRLIDNLILL